jgi:hypothetical protein
MNSMTDLSPAQAVLCAYRDLSWTPDEEDNGKYFKFSHKAGMAAALRAAADQLFPEPDDWTKDNMSEQGLWLLRLKRDQLLAIADELEGQ